MPRLLVTLSLTISLIPFLSIAGQAVENPQAGKAKVPPGVDRFSQQVINALNLLIKEEEWESVGRVLGGLLQKAEERLVMVERIGADGKPIQVIVDVRDEADRLLLSLPPAVMTAYQKKYSTEAEESLKKAQAAKDQKHLAYVARAYRYTSSGVTAAAELALQSQGAGQFGQAVQHFKRLLEWPGPDKLDPVTLYRAALCFRHTGDLATSETVWKKLEPRVGAKGLRIGDRTRSLDELRKELEKIVQ